MERRPTTNAMNEWDFIGQGNFVGIGKSATSNKFGKRSGFVREERLVLSNLHTSSLDVVIN